MTLRLRRELVAVDWGTSRCRAALIGSDGQVLAQRACNDGILQVPPGGFEAVFERLCGDWMHDGATPPRLCLMSGMVGSRNGWREAAYAPCPAGFDELPAQLLWLKPGQHAIVPGLQCEHDGMPDVMRGEEVQVFGAVALLGLRDGVMVLPGTHSKWCAVRDGRITGFHTCMSGEFYALLREHSILGRTIPESQASPDATEADDATAATPEPPWQRNAFLAGLAQARRSGSLLASAFSARSQVLMQQLAPTEVPDYLSGLVIGEELRVAVQAGLLADAGADPVVLIGTPALTERYAVALTALGQPTQRVGAEATWHGLGAIAARLT